MKKLLSNPHLSLMARIFLGLLFIISGLDKIVDPGSFSLAIANYKILPAWLPMIVATILPWLELLCGFSLLFGVMVRGSSLLLASMLLVFTLAVTSGLFRGLDISCGCFTGDPSVDKIGWMKVLQNLTLLALTLFLYFSKTGRFTLATFLRQFDPGDDQSA